MLRPVTSVPVLNHLHRHCVPQSIPQPDGFVILLVTTLASPRALLPGDPFWFSGHPNGPEFSTIFSLGDDSFFIGITDRCNTPLTTYRQAYDFKYLQIHSLISISYSAIFAISIKFAGTTMCVHLPGVMPPSALCSSRRSSDERGVDFPIIR